MKTLLIIRHAKSDWHAGLPDFDRPLNVRGLRDASVMAQRLADVLGNVDALIHSSSQRTSQTATYFIEALGVPNVISEANIYEADIDTLVDTVMALDSNFKKVILVGHNPGVSELIRYYTGQSLDMVTCAMACLTFEMDDWQTISKNSGTLMWLDIPNKESKRSL